MPCDYQYCFTAFRSSSLAHSWSEIHLWESVVRPSKFRCRATSKWTRLHRSCAYDMPLPSLPRHAAHRRRDWILPALPFACERLRALHCLEPCFCGILPPMPPGSLAGTARRSGSSRSALQRPAAHGRSTGDCHCSAGHGRVCLGHGGRRRPVPVQSLRQLRGTACRP